MDKIKLNNQIISMRKFVKQGKVRLINKLVKNVKRLQVKHGNDLQMQKFKRKSEKLLAEVQILKNLNVDNVSKAALAKEKDWKDLLASKNSTPQERALAMLANYDAVQSQVDSFHADNAKIIPQIPDLIKIWEEKKSFKPDKNSKTLKASAIRQKKKERTSKKRGLSSPASIAADNDNRFKFNEAMHKDDNTGESGSESENSGELLESHSSEKPNRKSATVDSPKGVTSMEMTENKEPSSSSKNEPRNKLVPKTRTEKQVALLKLEDLKGADTIPIDRLSESEEAGSDSEKDDSDAERDKKKDSKNDPFFITGDEPVTEEQQFEESMSDSGNESPARRHDRRSQRGRKPGGQFGKRDFPAGRRDFKPRNAQERNGDRFSRRGSAPNRNFGNKRFDQRQDRGKSFPRRDFNDKSSFTRNGPQNRQDSTRRDFKSTFRGNNQMLPRREKNNELGNPKNAKSQRTPLSGGTSQTLHPSWEAKKKQKQREFKIAPFQGTKIKFQD